MAFTVAEPWMTPADEALTASDNPLDFLGLSAFGAVDLKGAPAFVGTYLDMVEAIRARGAMAVLESIL